MKKLRVGELANLSESTAKVSISGIKGELSKSADGLIDLEALRVLGEPSDREYL